MTESSVSKDLLGFLSVEYHGQGMFPAGMAGAIALVNLM